MKSKDVDVFQKLSCFLKPLLFPVGGGGGGEKHIQKMNGILHKDTSEVYRSFMVSLSVPCLFARPMVIKHPFPRASFNERYSSFLVLLSVCLS